MHKRVCRRKICCLPAHILSQMQKFIACLRFFCCLLLPAWGLLACAPDEASTQLADAQFYFHEADLPRVQAYLQALEASDYTLDSESDYYSGYEAEESGINATLEVAITDSRRLMNLNEREQYSALEELGQVIAEGLAHPNTYELIELYHYMPWLKEDSILVLSFHMR